jgi:long-chain acyl-CoA synthetase
MQWWRSGPDTTEWNTYADVGWIVKDLTCGLMSIEIEKSDRICIMSANCRQWLWADFAILCAGAVTTTIYPSSSTRELSYIVKNSGAKMIFVRDQAGVDKVLATLNDMPTLQKEH